MSYFRVIIQMRWSRTKVVTLSRRRNRKYFVLGLNMTTQFCLNLSQYCGTATLTFVAQDTSLTNCTTLFLPRKNEMSGPHFLFQSNSKIITIALAGHIFVEPLKCFEFLLIFTLFLNKKVCLHLVTLKLIMQQILWPFCHENFLVNKTHEGSNQGGNTTINRHQLVKCLRQPFEVKILRPEAHNSQGKD